MVGWWLVREHQVPHLPRSSHRHSTWATPVHPTLWRAPSAAPATQFTPAQRRRMTRTRTTPRRTSDPLETTECCELVGSNWLVAVCGWNFVGDSLLVAIGWRQAAAVCRWQLVGGSFWWQLVGGNWLVAIGWGSLLVTVCWWQLVGGKREAGGGGRRSGYNTKNKKHTSML